MSKQQEQKGKNGFTIPRWAVPFFWAVIVLVIQIMLPWVLSLFGPRIGWSQEGPAWWNLLGFIAISIGLALYIWCLTFHFRTYHSSVQLGISPPELVTGGPYQISRNPMYASGLFVWFGWVVYYGSPAVLIAFLVLYCVFSFRVIPLEEHQLEELFGENYHDYKRTVRRWIGRFESIPENKPRHPDQPG